LTLTKNGYILKETNRNKKIRRRKISIIEEGIIEKILFQIPDEGEVFCSCSICNEKIFKGDYFYYTNLIEPVCEECGEDLFRRSRMIADEIQG
jgi:hypothetical protein